MTKTIYDFEREIKQAIAADKETETFTVFSEEEFHSLKNAVEYLELDFDLDSYEGIDITEGVEVHVHCERCNDVIEVLQQYDEGTIRERIELTQLESKLLDAVQNHNNDVEMVVFNYNHFKDLIREVEEKGLSCTHDVTPENYEYSEGAEVLIYFDVDDAKEILQDKGIMPRENY